MTKEIKNIKRNFLPCGEYLVLQEIRRISFAYKFPKMGNIKLAALGNLTNIKSMW